MTLSTSTSSGPALASTTTPDPDPAIISHDEFINKFNKNYENEEEAKKRIEIFKENVKAMEEHNKLYEAGKSSFQKGVNEYSDLTYDEVVSNLMGLQASDKNGRITRSFTYYEPTDLGKEPASMDYRDKKAVNPIRDQDQCGSCWAFATVSCIESAYFLKYGSLPKFSEQDLVDCSKENSGCNGGDQGQAMDHIAVNGIALRADYPYNGKNNSCKTAPKRSHILNEHKQVREGKEDELKNAIVHTGPISISMHCSDNFKDYKTGIFFDEKCLNKDNRVNHAMTLVGYGTENGEDYWLIRNQWGESWGIDGYIKVARNKDDHCAISSEATIPIIGGQTKTTSVTEPPTITSSVTEQATTTTSVMESATTTTSVIKPPTTTTSVTEQQTTTTNGPPMISTTTADPDPAIISIDEFIKKFNKVYENEEERSKRIAIFKENVKTMEVHNKLYEAGESSYQMGVNEYSDLIYEEIVNRLMGISASDIDGRSQRSFSWYMPKDLGNEPASLDYRDTGAVNPIRDQDPCRSCWAFATVASMESAYFLKYGSSIELSEQDLVDCFDDGGCVEGGWPHAAIDYVANNGIALRDDYAYNGRDNPCKPDRNRKRVITGRQKVNVGKEDELKNALWHTGPLTIVMYCSDNFGKYKKGIFFDKECLTGEPVNHAMTLIGYGTENGQDYWLIRNQWGESYGIDGYWKLARNKNNHCFISSWADIPIIEDSSSSPSGPTQQAPTPDQDANPGNNMPGNNPNKTTSVTDPQTTTTSVKEPLTTTTSGPTTTTSVPTTKTKSVSKPSTTTTSVTETLTTTTSGTKSPTATKSDPTTTTSVPASTTESVSKLSTTTTSVTKPPTTATSVPKLTNTTTAGSTISKKTPSQSSTKSPKQTPTTKPSTQPQPSTIKPPTQSPPQTAKPPTKPPIIPPTKPSTKPATKPPTQGCSGKESAKCIKKKGSCISPKDPCSGKRKKWCSDKSCDCCVPKKGKNCQPSKKCLKRGGTCLKGKNKWKKYDGVIDEKQCTGKKCACAYQICCKPSTKCAAKGGFCTTDPSKSCKNGKTEAKLCKPKKDCTCCILDGCFNDPEQGKKQCTHLGGQCTRSPTACENGGGTYKNFGCKYQPESGDDTKTTPKRKCGCCVPKVPKCCVAKKKCTKKGGKCISGNIACEGKIIKKGCKGGNCQCCAKKKKSIKKDKVVKKLNPKIQEVKVSKTKNHEEKKKKKKENQKINKNQINSLKSKNRKNYQKTKAGKEKVNKKKEDNDSKRQDKNINKAKKIRYMNNKLINRKDIKKTKAGKEKVNKKTKDNDSKRQDKNNNKGKKIRNRNNKSKNRKKFKKTKAGKEKINKKNEDNDSKRQGSNNNKGKKIRNRKNKSKNKKKVMKTKTDKENVNKKNEDNDSKRQESR